MRAPIFVSVCAIVLVGCGDDSTGIRAPDDASASDGAGAETGSSADGGAVDATSGRDAAPAADANTDATGTDAPGDASASRDALADSSADAVPSDAIAPTDANPVDAADANFDNTGPCADSGAWDGGFCCGFPSTPTPEGPNDCGRCGHSCGGGTCSSGVCQPFVLATLPDTLTQAYDIAANDNFVFVSGSDSNEVTPIIDSVPVDGGAVQIFARTTDESYELFADPSTLYWAGNQSISADSIDAGSVATIVSLDTAGIAGFGAAPTGAFLYWAQISETDNLTVWMNSVDGGPPTDIWDGGNQQCGGVEFAATASDVYWSYSSNNTGPMVPVLTAPLGSTAFTTTAVSIQDPTQLSVQGNKLFVFSYSSGNLIEAIPLGDGGAPTFYGDEAGAAAYAVDPSWVYIADQANTLQAFPLDGGSSVMLDDSFEFEPQRLAHTPRFLYWVTSGPPMAVMGVATP